MKNFKNFKLKPENGFKFIHMHNRLFNNRVKRIVLNTTLSFCGGALLTFGVISILNNANVKKGVGGFEIPAENASFVEPVTEMVSNEAAGSRESLSDSASAEKVSLDNSGVSLQDEDLALISEINENATEEDSLEAAHQIFSQENTDIDLELCYYTYRVKKGDMIGYIADNFGITQDTIISVNNIHQSRLLQIGQYLKIPSMPGIIYTVRKDGETVDSISTKYEVSADKCCKANNLERNVSLTAGTTVFVPDAELDWVTRQEINGDLFHKPIHNRYYVSSLFGWRSSPFSGKRSYHSGIDMACPTGTPIYAALGGVVSSTGFNNVYGNYVIVTHHSGYKTLYGHMSAILVTKGKYVDTNTRIGKVGSTGMSTGPHLHFTVYKNGKTVNPAALWR